MKKIIVKYPIEMKEDMDKVDFLEFLGQSLMDNEPMYSVKIPENFLQIDVVDIPSPVHTN